MRKMGISLFSGHRKRWYFVQLSLDSQIGVNMLLLRFEKVLIKTVLRKLFLYREIISKMTVKVRRRGDGASDQGVGGRGETERQF